jgi:FkbM family methyltransferase
LPSPDELAAEYDRLERHLRDGGDRPGRGSVLGWDLEYPSPACLLAFLDYIAYRRINDFVSTTGAPAIVDCGANIGYTTLWYKRQFPDARIVAFEPDPVFAGLLRRNLARNGASDVEVVEAAAWVRDGRAPWLSLQVDGSRLTASSDEARGCTVATVDLRRYLDREITLLKIDVEGAEFELLPHLADSLGRVRQVLVECHLLDQCTYSRLGGVLDALRAAGFRVALNSYGPWRDLIRRHTPGPHQAEQYLLVSGWRDEDAPVDRVATCAPYAGLTPSIERSREREELGRILFQSVAHRGWQAEALLGPFRRERGRCWMWECPPHVPSGDDQAGHRSDALLFEDDRLLGPAHAQHDEIRARGYGRYSHWGRHVYFASSDGSNPNVNGRRYSLVHAGPAASPA